jgi:hypothetical protein
MSVPVKESLAVLGKIRYPQIKAGITQTKTSKTVNKEGSNAVMIEAIIFISDDLLDGCGH